MAWEIDTLKEYVDSRVEAQDKSQAAAVLAIKEAVDKANTASEKRFEGVNEFRNTLSDQQKTLLTRDEYLLQHTSLERRMQDLTDRINVMSGKSQGFNGGWAILTGAIGMAAAAGAIIYYLAHLRP